MSLVQINDNWWINTTNIRAVNLTSERNSDQYYQYYVTVYLANGNEVNVNFDKKDQALELIERLAS